MASSNLPILSRYEGCFLGAIFGDCLGAKFEKNWSEVPIESVITYFEKVKRQVTAKELEAEKGFVHYTDDSCMTFDLAESLVKKKEFKPKNVAKHFSETFFSTPFRRYYGMLVVSIFDDLRDMKYAGDIWRPARNQFDGSGSYGNGSAMRVCPVSLFYHGDPTNMINLAAEQSKLTHTHPKGINGAILQALAIEKAMELEKILDPVKFCQELIAQLKEFSPAQDGLQIYDDQARSIVRFLKTSALVQGKEINSIIGSNVTAQQAVPAAIFSFLYTLDAERIPLLAKYNGLERAVIFAVAFSRDADTIGSMAGAIAGAYYGVDTISEEWKFACEGAERALELAKKLLKLNQKHLK